VINTDGHTEDDLFTPERYFKVGRGAGLSPQEVTDILKKTLSFAQSKLQD